MTDVRKLRRELDRAPRNGTWPPPDVRVA
jgi:hypothetical protein